MKKNTHPEKPFEYLGVHCDATVQNWYKSRKYVLDLLNSTLDTIDVLPEHWHFVVDGDNDLMLSVVRHLALYAHFINYEENYDTSGNLTCKNRTIITIVSKKKAEEIEAELQKPEYLGNLPTLCQMTVFGDKKNEDSYIDIAIEIVTEAGSNCVLQKIQPIITEEKVLKYIESIHPDDIFSIDTRKALCGGKVYNLGDVIDNIPFEDINSANRYSNALSTFNNKVLRITHDEKLIEEEWKSNLSAAKSGISNVFCSDCFEIREKEIKKIEKKDKLNESDWSKHITELSHCEHNRWVVEKLILGYQPLGRKERFEYEHLFGDSRKAYVKKLKSNIESPMHIDICSNRDLRRIDPDNMKYDSFLMLAIPLILSNIRHTCHTKAQKSTT